MSQECFVTEIQAGMKGKLVRPALWYVLGVVAQTKRQEMELEAAGLRYCNFLFE